MTRPLALVTGASGGIGADLARELAADGHDLVLVARQAEPMAQLAAILLQSHGAQVAVVPCDLAAHGAVDGLVAELAARGLSPDVLVNNAGFGDGGPFDTADPGRIGDMIRLNILALTELTRALLPAMLARGRGRVLNVASTAAFQPGPTMAVYSATKAYVLSFSEAIAAELAGRGVTVTALCPGPTRTGFATAAGVTGNRLFAGPLVMSSARVAALGYAALKRGRRVVVTGLLNRVMAASAPLSPRPVTNYLARLLLATPH